MYAATDEKHDAEAFARIPADKQLAARGIEVGHIFYFGTKYSKPMNAKVTGPNGDDVFAEMGSYGIGVSRLVGGIIEADVVDGETIGAQFTCEVAHGGEDQRELLLVVADIGRLLRDLHHQDGVSGLMIAQR